MREEPEGEEEAAGGAKGGEGCRQASLVDAKCSLLHTGSRGDAGWEGKRREEERTSRPHNVVGMAKAVSPAPSRQSEKRAEGEREHLTAEMGSEAVRQLLLGAPGRRYSGRLTHSQLQNFIAAFLYHRYSPMNQLPVEWTF